uniref:adenylyl-sulfate kinase n=1 Tax=Trichocoleus desertorum TaxID=1481672 RepID=UPI0025B2AEA2|nr:adenylyl-sulfate kinase [Trichocoleus desertorum]
MSRSTSYPGFTCWLTGLPGSGKSTLAVEITKALHQLFLSCERLDGDVLRENLSKDLGFSPEARNIHVERVGFICGLLNKHGVNTCVALISPYKEARENVKSSLPHFIEIYVDCPLEVCIERDPKGLYKKALAGELKDFTGLTAPYEAPTQPDLILKTHELSIEQSVDQVLQYLHSRSLISTKLY